MNRTKQTVSFFLCFCMLIALLPIVTMTAFAAESWFWPVDGVYAMSRGYFSGHYGIDIAASLGTTVRATKSGTVIESANSCPHTNYGSGCSCNGGCGNYVKIKHTDGTYSRYLHLTQGTAIANGTVVSQGDTVGKSGSSGDSTGPHLHFECYNTSNVRINNNPTDPRHTYYGSHDGTGISYIYEVGGSTPQGALNIGEDFFAFIIKNDSWKHLEATSGGNVQIASNGNNSLDPKQIWHFTRQPDGSYKIENEFAGLCLDADNWGTANGTNVGVVGDNGTTAQRWYIFASGQCYSIAPSYSTNLALDSVGDSNDPGTNIQLYSSNGTTAQQFSVYNLVNDGVNYSKPARPNAPTIQSVTYVNDTQVKVSWSSSPLLGSYDTRVYDLRIYQGSAVTDESFLSAYYDIPGTNYTLSLPKGTYTFSIAAVNTRYYEWYTFGNNYTKSIDPCSNGHKYSYSVTTAPTTSATGVLTGTCSRCGNKTTITLPKLNTTDYNYSVTKPATCTATGTGRYTWKTTTYGSFYFDVTIPKTAHSYTTTVTQPTCTAQGYTTHTCSVCGDSYKDSYTNALGHSWDAGTVTLEPTETEPGVKTFTCTRCGETKTEPIPATGHTHNYTATVIAPTCTERGYTIHACACGDSYIDTYTAALGHAWDAGVVTTKPTETATGIMTYTCTRCGEMKTETIPTLEPDPTPSLPCDGGDSCPGNVFTDMPAKGNWAHDAIDWAIVNKITAGTSATTFSPNAGCTRAQVVTFLWRAAGEPEPETTNNPFEDVKEGTWYYKAVLWAAETGVTAGTSATTFSPDATCTRAQIVTFLWRFEGEPASTTTNNPFTDVKAGAYYEKAVLWASETGVTAGTSATTFSPSATCTRAQIVTFLYRDLAA